MKKRGIVAFLLLSFFTFGIYIIYWYIKFQIELKSQTNEGFGGFLHFIVTLFSFGIYTLIWNYKVGGRLEMQGAKNNGVLYLVLTLFGFGIVSFALMQNEANSIATH